MAKKIGQEGSAPTPKQESEKGPELEWGPELGRMSQSDAEEKVEELNAKLVEGEKPWRLPTKDELIIEFNKTGSVPAGFRKDYYWSSTVSVNFSFPRSKHYVSMNNGIAYSQEQDVFNCYVRLVRDAA